MYRLLMTILLLFLIGCQEQVVVPSPLSDRGLDRPFVNVQGQIKTRVALVIGNANYKFAPLNNPVNDARDMAKALRSVGFHVIYKENAGWEEMDNGINEFEALLGKGVIGLFYFSGHGVQLENKNYLIPVDLPKLSIRHVKFRSISAGDVLTAMEQKGNSMNLLILDACRDNPFKSLSKNLKRGLARMGHVPTGTLIAYATSPGDTAADGYGRNSPYTKHLVKFIRQSGLTVEMMFKRVRNAVVRDTSNDQTPWESSSLQGEDFYFGGKTTVASASDTPPVVPPRNTGQDAEIARLKRKAAEAEAKAERERQARIKAERRAEQDATRQAEIERLKRKQARAEAKAEKERLARIKAEKRRKKTSKFFRDTLRIGGKGPEMVRIPAGSFRMGDIQGGGESDEKPVHRVSVSAFAMGKYEVTVGEFKRFVKSTRYRTDAEKGRNCWTYKNGSLDNQKGANWRNPIFSQNDSHPVTCVSWNDATAYVKWLSQQTRQNYRLPTEAEWEYAARAGTTTKYWWGNTPSHEYMNYGTNSCCNPLAKGKDRWKYTSPVGSFVANKFGLYDTAGNLWEWTCSEYESKYQGDETKCKKRASRFVLRGGSWVNGATGARSANRTVSEPWRHAGYDGFRLARTN